MAGVSTFRTEGEMAITIDELIARRAILDVIHRYCRAMDRIDNDLARSVWHPEGTAHYGSIDAD